MEKAEFLPRVSSRGERLVLNIALWATVGAYLGLFAASLVIADWALAPAEKNPLLGVNKSVLLKLGATATFKITEQLQWWRLASSLFLPAGTLHLWSISSALWTFSLFLNNAMAPWQLVLLFLTSGLAGVTVSANVASNFVTSAASGPIFGLMGGTLVLLILHWRAFRHRFAALVLLAIDIALNVYMGLTPFVDNIGNTAGFVTGCLVTGSLLLLNKPVSGSAGREACLRLLCVLLMVGAIAICVTALVGLNLSKSPVAACCDKWTCVDVGGLWDCNAARITLPCSFSRYTNGSIVMGCPSGGGQALVDASLSEAAMLALCDTTCGGSGSSGSSPSPSPDDSTLQ